jgi:hypothetical protein
MAVNNIVTGDPRSFFYYKGDFYINGTEIILKDEYINSHKWNGKKLWKYAKYKHQVFRDGRVAYFFCQSKADWLSLNEMGIDEDVRRNYAPYFVVEALDIENLIEGFTHPIKLKRKETDAIMTSITESKSDFDNSSLMCLWIVYIAAMIASLIFNHFYILWIAASVIFFKIRKEMLE